MGERRLDAALKDFPHSSEVEIIYRCFELDPTMGRDVNYDTYEKLARKYGMSRDQAIESCNNLKRQAQMVGLEFNFDTLVLTNTFDAHRLTLFAAQFGKTPEMIDRLFRAYFTESKHIGDPSTLVQLAAEVGLDPDSVAAMLKQDDYANRVRADEEEAQRLNIYSIPFYLFDRKYKIIGAQPSNAFLTNLEKAFFNKI